MRRRCARQIVVSVLTMVALPIVVRAQLGTGAMTGIVRYQGGAVLPGATLTVISLSTGAVRTAVATADGHYAVPGLAPGDYRVDVAMSGFRPVRRERVQVTTGETVSLDFDLAIGDIAELVVVQAAAPMVPRDRSSLGSVIDHRKIVDLPLNGRSFISLASLAPGVALPPNSQLPRINGGRPRTNEYLFDGISVLQPEPGQVAFFPIVDAIQEFKIESNSPPAEFGRFNGGVINLTTRSGTNT